MNREEVFGVAKPNIFCTMASRAKPTKKEKSTANEDFEVLDVSDVGKEAESLFRYAKKYIKEGSHSKQLAVGGASGW